jgi:hypothetical protein
MTKLMMILHILVRRLIVLGRLKIALALFSIVILNMNFYTSKINTHNTLITTCLTTLFFSRYQKTTSKHSNVC